MDRREFLQCAAVLVSGTGAARLAFALSEEQSRFLAANANYAAGKVDYLSPEQRKIVAAMAETILPRTDTPGAIDAGVPRYLELMMADWLNDDERAVFDAGIAAMQTRIPEQYGKPFYALEQAQQQQILEAMEADAADSDWYSGARRPGDFASDAPFICQFKELTVYGFFTSEVGATQVLRYNAMPMYFDGDRPLEPGAGGWSTTFA